MPTAAPRLCPVPGCRNLAPSGQPRCDLHYKPVNHRDHTRICVIDAEEASRIRSGVAWQKLRDALRHQRPLCALCNRWTEHIHHIVPLVEAPELAYTPSNLAPLCRLCHGRVEAMTTAGRRAEVAALLKGKEFRAVIGIG